MPNSERPVAHPPGEGEAARGRARSRPAGRSRTATQARLLIARITVKLSPFARASRSPISMTPRPSWRRPRAQSAEPRVTSASARTSRRSACSAASRTRSRTSSERRCSSCRKSARPSWASRATNAGSGARSPKLLDRRLQHLQRALWRAGGEQGPGQQRQRPRRRVPVAGRASPFERLPQEVLGGRVVRGGGRLLPGPVEQVGLLGRVRRHRQGLLQERHGLLVRAERGRPLGGAAQGQPGLAGQGVGLGPLGRVGVGGEVVTGEGAGQLVRAQPLEVARGREVAGLPLAPGKRAVGDLADQRLDERVLAALGAPWIGVHHQHLAADEGPQVRRHRRARPAR